MVGKKTFVKIFLITTMIFVIGIFVGFSIDTIRNDIISSELSNANLETDSYIISEMYLKDSNNYCSIADSMISHIANITEYLGSNLEEYGKMRMFRKESYDHLLRRYYTYELRFWMLVKEYKIKCNKKIVDILYFFGPNDIDSTKQGYVLTAIRKKYQPNFMVFSFNADFNKEPSLFLVKKTYNITVTPTLIINGKKYEGFKDMHQLEAIVNSYLKR